MAGLRPALRQTTALGRFAHLLGFPAQAKARRADDEDKSPKEDDDTGARKGSRAEEERDDEAARAEEDEGETDDDEEVDEDEPKSKKAKGKKKASDDEECEEEGDDDEDVAKAAKAGRKFERARCAAIFASAAAAVRPDMAAHLAFETAMSAAAAIGILETAAAGGRVRVADARREARPRVDLGGGAPAAPSGASATAAAIIEAGKRRRGEK